MEWMNWYSDFQHLTDSGSLDLHQRKNALPGSVHGLAVILRLVRSQRQCVYGSLGGD